jgi:hypothetical protein
MAGLFLSLTGLLACARLVDAVEEGSYGLRKNSSTGGFDRPNDGRRLLGLLLLLRLLVAATFSPDGALTATLVAPREVAPDALSLLL